MTEPREWPDKVKIRRDRAAEEYQEVDKIFNEILELPGLPAEVYRLVGIGKDHAATGLRHLEKAGAQTDPQ